MGEYILGRGGRRGVAAFVRTVAAPQRIAVLRRSASRLALVLFVGGASSLLAQPAFARNWDVWTAFQLDGAVGYATSGDTITFMSDITLSRDLPPVVANLTFNGNGRTLSGGSLYGAFHVAGPVTVAIKDLNIIDSRAMGHYGGNSSDGPGGGGGSPGLGGGLYVDSFASVTLSSVTFERNLVQGGGGGGPTGFDLLYRGGGGGAGMFETGGYGKVAGNGGDGGRGGGGRGGSTIGYGRLPINPKAGGGANTGYVAESGGFGGGGGGAGPNNGPGGNGGFGAGGGGGSQGWDSNKKAYETQPGKGGFGGGDGGGYVDFFQKVYHVGKGGGGAGFGGAIFVKAGGRLVLDGTSTVADNLVFAGNGAAALGSGLFLQGFGTLTFAPEAGRTQTINDTIATEGANGGSGDYVLIKKGAGTTSLTGTNAYSGHWQVDEGTLRGHSGSLVTNIANNAAVVFDQSQKDVHGDIISGTYGHVISGTGSVSKTGVGTLTLAGVNTYTGVTNVWDGVLLLGSSNVLPSASVISVDGGRFGVEGITASIGNAITIRTEPGTGIYAGAGGNLTLTGVVSGRQLVKTGAGELRLTGTNTFNGANVTGGTLRFSSDANLGALNAAITVRNATIATTINSHVEVARPLQLEGKAVIDVDNTLTWRGPVSGSGTLVKTGTGDLSLTEVNSYEGGTSIVAGTLTPTSDAALGKAGALLSVGGGALLIRQDFETSRPVTTDGGTFRVSEGKTLTLDGVVSGGSLTTNGEGTLRLMNSANTYTGSNYIRTGRLLGHSSSIRGDIVFMIGATDVTFDETEGGTFRGNISGPGAFIKTGSGSLQLAGVNSYTGGTTVHGGDLIGSTESLQGNVLNNGRLTFNQAHDGTYSGDLTGAGQLIKDGTGRVSLTGRDVVGGGTTIRGGTLAVNGTLVTPVVVVNKGGTLAGSQNVQGEVELRGGTIAPGNSIGTIHISGDLTMEPESDYRVEINGSASDRIKVGGSATILSSTFEIARYNTALSPVLPGTTYTILTTAGGLIVQSPTVAIADFPFLTFTLSEDGFNGYLTTSRSSERFAELASTPNEIAVANALDVVGSGAAWEQVVGASEAQARSAFASLGNASFHASVLSVLSNQSHFLRDAVINRLADANAGQVLAVDGLPPTNGPAAADASAPVYAMWGQVLGSWGTFDGNSNAARVTDQIGGLVTGVDVSVADTWRFGIAGGYSYTSFDASDIAASGSADSYHVALYGGWQSDGWSVRGGAAYSWNDIDTSRQVAVVGLSGAQDGGYDLGTTQLFAEGAYKFVQGTSTFEPFANLAYVLVDGDVSESGMFATSGSAEMNTTYTTLGLRASTVLMDRLTARGTLGWRHAFGDVTPEVSLAFDTGGPAFGLTGAPIAVNALVAELGVDYALTPDATLSVTYSGQYGSDAYENSAQASLTWRF